MTDLIDELKGYYSEDPNLGDIVFLKNKFEDVSVRGEIVGLNRKHPNRALAPDHSFEVVLYQDLEIRVAGFYQWFDTNEWEITDRLTGWEYKKLHPEVVLERTIENIEDED